MTNRVRILSFALLAGMAGLATPSQAAPKACPDIYQPVCAVNPAGGRETYPNACSAQRAHARMLHTGRCVGPICFFIFNPVCARNPATHKPQTYSNLCAAENANATLIRDGACK
jgi:hypothetical protein